jgi:hypothetical protein
MQSASPIRDRAPGTQTTSQMAERRKMKLIMRCTLGILFASLPLASSAVGLFRCTAPDGKSYSYLTRESCKSPADIRVSVSATKAIAPIQPKMANEVITVSVPSPIERKIEKEIQDYWKACRIVQPAKLKILSNENRIVRFSYMLKILSDGAKAKPADCPPANSSMLQALANENLDKLKAGTEVEVTQEQAVR